jgi:hypothetical protein
MTELLRTARYAALREQDRRAKAGRVVTHEPTLYHEGHDDSERRKFQKISFSWNSIAQGAPSAFTPVPSPRRRRFPAPPCSSALVVPFGEPTPPLSMLLKGMPGPSKLEKLNTLKKEIPGRSVTLSLILWAQLRLRSKVLSHACPIAPGGASCNGPNGAPAEGVLPPMTPPKACSWANVPWSQPSI